MPFVTELSTLAIRASCELFSVKKEEAQRLRVSKLISRGLVFTDGCGLAAAAAPTPDHHFAELTSLSGNNGAKRIIQHNNHRALDVIGDCLDIDTAEDQTAMDRISRS